METEFLQKKNNAAGTLLEEMAVDASTFTLNSGQGSYFPSGNFRVSMTTSGGIEEIMHCVSRTSDTFTVVRSPDERAEGTAAHAHHIGDTVQLRITEAMFKEYDDAINAVETDLTDHSAATNVHGVTGAIVGTTNSQTLTNKRMSTGTTIDSSIVVSQVLNVVYPIGCIYTTTIATNPATVLGFGTWTSFGSGRTMVGFAGGDSDFGTVEATGGHKEVQSHTHTVDPPNTTSTGQSNDHSHAFDNQIVGGRVGPDLDDWAQSWGLQFGGSYGASANHTHDVNIPSFSSGNYGTGTGRNLQPYIVVYFWKRTA